MINHLSDQNEELFNNYRKSQRLALAMGRDNHRMAQMRSFSGLQQNCHEKKNHMISKQLDRNVDLIAALKEKIAEIERENESLAGENEELRQFSLDGFQLA